MRLIDADELLMHLADYQLQENPGWGANGYGNKEKYEAITECIRAVEEAPTIDPVKYGKWYDEQNYLGTGRTMYFCSECGSASYRKDPYCWHCGAKTDEVEA